MSSVPVLATFAAAVLGGTILGLVVAPRYELRRDVVLAAGVVAFFVIRPFMADVVALAFLILPLLYGVRLLVADRPAAAVVPARVERSRRREDIAA